MQTVIAWLEYTAADKPPIYTQEYSTFGTSFASEFDTVAQFLDSIKTLARKTGYKVNISNVVIG